MNGICTHTEKKNTHFIPQVGIQIRQERRKREGEKEGKEEGKEWEKKTWFLTNKSWSRKKIYLEFHGGKFIENLSHVLTDNGPCDLIVTLGSGLYSSAGHIIE